MPLIAPARGLQKPTGDIARLGIALVVIGIIGIQGCDKDSRVETLQRQFQDLDKNVKSLKEEVETLKSSSSVDRFERNAEGIAYLTPGSNGYSIIRTELGPLTVSLDDIKPYANGSRVTLRFGNPMNVNLDDVSATLDWGTVDNKGVPQNEDAKSKEITFSKSFRPGSWNSVDAILEGVPPTSLGFVRVHDVTNKGIHLYK